MRRLILFAVVLILTGCATEAPIAQTPSGRPEATFVSTTPEIVVGKLSQGCMNNGMIVYESSPNHVLCGKTMQGGNAVLAQMLVGNSYSTTPEQRIRFALIKLSDDVRVQAYQWIESQMAFGQVNRQELNSGKHFNGLMRFLYSVGGQ